MRYIYLFILIQQTERIRNPVHKSLRLFSLILCDLVQHIGTNVVMVEGQNVPTRPDGPTADSQYYGKGQKYLIYTCGTGTVEIQISMGNEI